MKFLNSDYSKGYANFAKKTSSAPTKKRSSSAPMQSYPAAKETAVASKSSGKNPRGGNASSAMTPAYGPQPLYGPQQKKGKLGKAKDAVAGKAQYLGAKTKNTLAKAGSFIAKNKVGAGLAAAGALGAGIGATALARKMRNKKK